MSFRFSGWAVVDGYRRFSRLPVLMSIVLLATPAWGGAPAGPKAAGAPPASTVGPSCPPFTGGTATPCVPGTPCLNWPARFELEGEVFLASQTPAKHSSDTMLYDYSNPQAPRMQVRFGSCPPLPLGLLLQHPESPGEACTYYFLNGQVYLTPAPPGPVGPSAAAAGGSCCLVFDKKTPFLPPVPSFPSAVQSWGVHQTPPLPPIAAPLSAQRASFFPSGGTPCGYYGAYTSATATSSNQSYFWPASFSGHLYQGQYIQVQYTRFNPSPQFPPGSFTLPAACQGSSVPYCVIPPNNAKLLGNACTSCHGPA